VAHITGSGITYDAAGDITNDGFHEKTLAGRPTYPAVPKHPE
jgi:hypothetical protein